MRPIRFRAWDKDGQEMIGPNDFYQNADVLPSGYKTGCHLSDFFNINKDGTVGKEHENIVLMQYTGLKDKNGKEIYEGDVVNVDGSRQIIKWLYSEWSVFDNTGEYGYSSGECEIIGNIYENPELLKK